MKRGMSNTCTSRSYINKRILVLRALAYKNQSLLLGIRAAFLYICANTRTRTTVPSLFGRK